MGTKTESQSKPEINNYEEVLQLRFSVDLGLRSTTIPSQCMPGIKNNKGLLQHRVSVKVRLITV